AARRAIVLVLKGVAMTEEENGHFLHAARFALRLPSVIRLLEYRRIPHQTRALSRKNILLRDRNTCQYCGELLTASDLTLDHVVPRSRGGLSTWENLVACCHPCNRRKGNHLPLEADMKLMREPHAFNLHTSRHIMRLMGHSEDNERIRAREAIVAHRTTVHIRLGNVRLLLAISAVVIGWASLIKHSIPIWWLLAPLVVFIGVAAYHTKVLRALACAQRAVVYYRNGLARIEDKWAGRGETGERFLDPHHIYAADLDLFGKSSLFELLSTGRTRIGEE